MEIKKVKPNPKETKLAVIGAGNAGQALAGVLASQGHQVRLYNRSRGSLLLYEQDPTVNCFGAVNASGILEMVTTDITAATEGADTIFVTTTANAHQEIAASLAGSLHDGQLILLFPGRTGGALVFREALKQHQCQARVFVAEAQSFIYACRIKEPGNIYLIGEKKYMPVAAFPREDTPYVIDRLRLLHPAYQAAENVLFTSFLNFGAIFHTGVLIFNAAAIERGSKFYFYQDITPTIADFVLKMDQERLALGRAYGFNLPSVHQWMDQAYPNKPGLSLCEHMRSNPAYFDIFAPDGLNSRYLLEDVPTGLVPYLAFAEAAGLDLPLLRSLVHISSALLGINFFEEGRTLDRMGLKSKTPREILELI